MSAYIYIYHTWILWVYDLLLILRMLGKQVSMNSGFRFAPEVDKKSQFDLNWANLGWIL